MNTCSDPSCTRTAIARGMCRKHYDRWYQANKGTEPDLRRAGSIEELLTSRRDVVGDCWLRTGSSDGKGYGVLRRKMVHRLSYELYVGPIPGDLQIDHLCRVRSCFNPAHLEAVTSRENTLRGFGPAAIHARKTHCPKGHPYDEGNTRVVVNERGRLRRCIACDKARVR